MAGYEKSLKLLKQELGEENVIASVFGTYETQILGQDSIRQGVLAATDTRVVFFAKKLGGHDFESFPYERISSVERGKNLMGKSIVLYTSGNTVSLKWINKGDTDGFVKAVDERSGRATQNAQSAAPAGDDIPGQIEKLAKLKDSGAISSEEYEKKKSELLAKM